MANEKMTNKTALTYVLTNCDVPSDVRAKLESMVTALERKAANPSHKPTAKQVENDNIKAKIVEFLAGTPDGATCTTIQKSIPELADSGNQRVSALLRPMVAAGTVVRSVVKGKAIFSIGTVED